MAMKKIYCSPVTTLIVFEAEEKLLTISGRTTDPVEGGDPTIGTGGNGSTPTTNPFAAFGNAKRQIWDDDDEVIGN